MTSGTKFHGIDIALAGEFVHVGMMAPDFSLVQGDLTLFNCSNSKGKRLLLNIFPSVDTPVCSASVRKFNELASNMTQTLVLCISKDLPFAQSRFCGAEGIKNVIMLSDFRPDSTFGKTYGVLMSNGPLEGLFARSVVVIDETGKILYTQMVDNIANEPDYDKALSVLKA